MNLTLFTAAFIIQLVGHRIGDYLFQTDWQAQNKTKDWWARWKHCVVYSLTISLMMLMLVNWKVAVVIYGITFLEHYWIDSRKPIVWWKTLLETKLQNR